MAEAESRKTSGYSARQLGYACDKWRQALGGTIAETVMMAVVGLAVGGTLAESIAEQGLLGAVLGGLIGAVGAPVLYWALRFLYHFFAAPAAIWREQNAEIQRLMERVEYREIMPETPESLSFASISTEPGLKIYHLTLTRPPLTPHFQVIHDTPISGAVSVLAMPIPDAIPVYAPVTVYRRLDNSFCFQLQEEQAKPLTSLMIVLQTSTPVKVTEIRHP
jgi:hypothetical protein